MNYDNSYEKMDFMFDRTFINEYGNNLERYSQDYGYEDLAEGDLRANYMRNMFDACMNVYEYDAIAAEDELDLGFNAIKDNFKYFDFEVEGDSFDDVYLDEIDEYINNLSDEKSFMSEGVDLSQEPVNKGVDLEKEMNKENEKSINMFKQMAKDGVHKESHKETELERLNRIQQEYIENSQKAAVNRYEQSYLNSVENGVSNPDYDFDEPDDDYGFDY